MPTCEVSCVVGMSNVNVSRATELLTINSTIIPTVSYAAIFGRRCKTEC